MSCFLKARAHRRGVAVALVLLALLSSCTVLAENVCYWVLEATQGQTSTAHLHKRWSSKDCPSGIVHYSVTDAFGNVASFPSMYSPDLLFTPADYLRPTATEPAYTSVSIDAKCDGIHPLCSVAELVVIVRAGSSTSTSTSTSTTTTHVPVSSSTLQPNTTTSTPVPDAPPVCNPPESVEAWVGETVTLHPLATVENCIRPVSVVIDSQSSADLFTTDTDAATGEPVILFDATRANTEEGVFEVSFHVVCSNSGASNQCSMSQVVVAKNHVSSSSSMGEVPACNTPVFFRTSFDAIFEETVAVNEGVAALCPIGADGASRHFVFTPTSGPTYNPEHFVLSSNGHFTYHAPQGPVPKVDAFTTTIGCAAGEEPAPGEKVHPLCSTIVSIRIAAAPPPSSSQEPTDVCKGDFHYVYHLNADGSFSPKVSSVAARATVVEDPKCPGNRYSTLKIRSNPVKGTLQDVSLDTGAFSYVPEVAEVTPEGGSDSFDFQLTCADTPSYVCTGTATMRIAVAENSEAVYTLRQGLVTCRGTCDAHTDGRADGKAIGSVDFDITSTGKLLIHAYTTVSDLQAQFVTFTPLVDTKSFLTSQAAPPGTHVSFEPTCLDAQATYGHASNVVTWENDEDSVTSVSQLQGVRLNTLTDNYRLGENYFQKFGGKHQNCDIFRENPCKLAPLLTPTLKDDNNNDEDNQTPPVEWKLYINGCDATWVGVASVESLRALRQPDHSATFKLISDSKLQGTLYLQTVAPADITDASKGITITSKPHTVMVTLKNTIVVDATSLPATAPLSAPEMSLAADIQFAVGRDKNSNERIYAYSILLYPSRYENGQLVRVNTSTVSLKSSHLDFFTFTSPNRVECPECTGQQTTCHGTGIGFETTCGGNGIVTFGSLDPNSMEYDRTPESAGGANLFPVTTISKTDGFYNMSFAVRANGEDSANSADAFPVGKFALIASFSNGQSFNLTVEQSDYVSEINSKYVRTRMCRASAYWPVPNALGSTVPVAPFDPATLSGLKYDANGEPVVEPEEDGANEPTPTYEAPSHLSTEATCKLPAMSDAHSYIKLTSDTATIDKIEVSMCAFEDERTYGVTDWFTLSIPSIQAEKLSIQEAVSQAVIEDSTLGDDAYTVAELQYLVLSLNASEALSINPTDMNREEERLNILLDGTNPPSGEISEEDRWMYADTTGKELTYYNWAQYASFLNYRRIRYGKADSTSSGSPFNFAFIPGALLHSSSSVRVPMHVSLSIKFTTYAQKAASGDVEADYVVVNEQEEKMLYVISVSRSTSAAMRFDSDAYEPKIVTVKTAGLGRKSATALLIIILVAVTVVLAASVYIEVTYKRIIHNAKYHPKRPDSAVGIRYGRDGLPKDGSGAEGSTANRLNASATSRGGSTTGASARKAPGASESIPTKFGNVGTEPTRIEDRGDNTEERKKNGNGGSAEVADGRDVEMPPIGDEQERVHDSEVASQV